MCGIAGIVGTDTKGESQMPAMLSALARRGPDGEGIATWPTVVLGHRRLSIIDLSEAGKQPMLSEDGNVGVVFNGCIYNFLELRNELERRGQRFHSQCDTEVLLQGYREWGIDGLVVRLRGMFAFAIWDNSLQKLLLVRDRLGVKPLVYVQSGRKFHFASTATALRAAGAPVGDLDPAAILDYLEFGFVTDNRSIYSGIRKLPPATILEWKDGAVSQRSYWQLPNIDESARLSFEDAVEETERLIVESVRLRLFADVPIGALLSGGVDSGLVCWAMKQLNADIRTFTVGTPGDSSDETEAARQTARALGVSHEVVTLDSEEDSNPLENLLNAYSEPFACQSALGMLRVSRAVKPKATVLLTGDGGDDVFLGYPFFRNAWRAQQLARHLPSGAERMWHLARPLIDSIGVLRRGKHFLDYAVGGLGSYNRVRDGIPFFEERSLFGKRLQGRKLAQRLIPPSSSSARRLLWDVFMYHRETHFTSEFMPKVDASTMYYALEARAPFLDHKLWEFAAALPPRIRFHGGALKAVLREIARRRINPSVATRRKQGFIIPAEKWLAGRWRSQFESLRSMTRLAQQGWIHQPALQHEIDRAIQSGEVPQQLWYLLVLENWLQKNNNAVGARSPVVAG